MKQITRKLSKLVLVGYTLLLSYWMLLGFGRRATHSEFMYNIKPFVTIRHFLQFDRFNTNIWMINLLGNIGVFVPFGILLALVFGGKLRKIYLIFIGGLFILESLQLLTRRGSFDIDDFILNSIGFLIGYGFYRMIIWFVNSRRDGIG